MRVGWGQLDSSAVYKLLQMQVYSWQVTHHVLLLEQAHSSRMLSTILQALEDTLHNETIFIGHDGDLAALGTMLDVGWSAPPFPDNTTAPSVGLRFELRERGSLRLDVVYTTFDTDSGRLLSKPVLEESISAF